MGGAQRGEEAAESEPWVAPHDRALFIAAVVASATVCSMAIFVGVKGRGRSGYPIFKEKSVGLTIVHMLAVSTHGHARLLPAPAALLVCLAACPLRQFAMLPPAAPPSLRFCPGTCGLASLHFLSHTHVHLGTIFAARVWCGCGRAWSWTST